MSKVDFYVLKGSDERSRQHFACRLAEKAYRLEHTVHIVVANPQSARQVDELMWTFRHGSFVPHAVVGQDDTETPAPVTIGIDSAPPRSCHLLINLGEETPASADSFARVAEIVTADEDARARSRQRFVDYRERGHTLDTHML